MRGNRGVRTLGRGRWLVQAAASALVCSTGAIAAPAAAQSATVTFNIPAQPLAEALMELSRQANVNVVAPSALTRGRRAPAVNGAMSVSQALDRLLANSGLTHRTNNGGSIVIGAAPGSGEAEAGGAAADSESVDFAQAGVAEILVIGNRSQNVDIRRTEDDAQPYVVFDRREIEQSPASNLEDFFRSRLPMNGQQGSNGNWTSQGGVGPSVISNISQVNLRGLGTGQTLILVDGRRAPRVSVISGGTATDFTQADINGIPLSSIERIEVLPSTAGAIYGGGATGGVINIIRRRSYSGVDLRLGYESPFSGGGNVFRAEVNGGFGLEGGRTQVSFSGSHVKTNPLYAEDNNLWRAGRDLLYANNPDAIFPFGSTTPNVRSLIASVNLVLDPQFGGTSLGSSRLFIPAGYRGVALDGIVPLLANTGQYNLALGNDVFVGRFQQLRAGGSVKSANLNVRREFTPWLDAFADLTISENRSRALSFTASANTLTLQPNNPRNPFQQAIIVGIAQPALMRPSSNTSDVLSATGGLIARLGGSWSATAQYEWTRSRNRNEWTGSALTQAGLAALTNGTLDPLQDTTRYPLDLSPWTNEGPDSFSRRSTEQQVISGRVSGRLVEVPGGPVAITALIERRMERALQAEDRNLITTATFVSDSHFVYPERSQAVNSGYLEVTVPILSPRNNIPFVHSLDLQGSVRHDRYSTETPTPSRYRFATPPESISYADSNFRSTSYTVAVRWAPSRDLTMRASIATGFLPPSIAQVLESGAFTFPGQAFGNPDPLRGNENLGLNGPFRLVSGGNPSLNPERSRSYSMGLVLTPRFAPGFRFSVDHTQIRKRDEIRPLDIAPILANPDAFPGRVERGPRLPTDPAGFAGPVILIDTSLFNIAESRIRAWDFQLDYDLQTDHLGSFHAYALATYQPKLTRQYLPSLPRFNTAGFSDGPLAWRGTLGLDWSLNGLEIGWNAQFYDSYSIRSADPAQLLGNNSRVAGQGAERISSQSYHDLRIGYRFGSDTPRALQGTRLAFGVQNIFNSRPPAIASTINGYSPYGDPRLRRFTISISRNLDFR